MKAQQIFDGIKGVIFDLDGTLLDSLGIWEKVDQEFFLSRGIPYPDDYHKAIAHKSLFEVARYTRDRFSLKESPEEICALWLDSVGEAYAHTIPLKPYVEDLLKKIGEKKIPIALATSTSSALYEPCLANRRIDRYFTTFLNCNDLKTSKAEPTIYLEAAKRIGSRPEDTLVFEDILMGITSAHSAGFRTVSVYDKASDQDWESIQKIADLSIRDFGEIL